MNQLNLNENSKQIEEKEKISTKSKHKSEKNSDIQSGN